MKQPYVEQVIFLNRQMLALVDDILQKSHTPPIIIIQGDHGSAHIRKKVRTADGRIKLRLPEERLAILNAILVPEQYRHRLYPSISPVNNFRLILSEQFGEPLPLLEDRHLFSWYLKPQHQVDVSRRLQGVRLDRRGFEAAIEELESR